MPTLETLIPRFKAADRQTRLETLLDYSKKLPPLPPRFEAEKALGHNRVDECQTTVYLWTEVDSGQVHIYADVPREAPTKPSPNSPSICSTSSVSVKPSA